MAKKFAHAPRFNSDPGSVRWTTPPGGGIGRSNVSAAVIGGRVADNSLYEQILAELPDQDVYNIGDSVEPRDVYFASHEAADVAELIRLKVDAGASRTLRTQA